MRFLLLILSFILPYTILFAQDGKVQSNGTPIRTSEKKALEAQFRVLGDYTIDDTGLVVFKKQSDNIDSSYENNQGESHSTVSEPINLTSPAIKELDTQNLSKTETPATTVVSKQPTNTATLSNKETAVIITKEAISSQQKIVVVEPNPETKVLTNETKVNTLTEASVNKSTKQQEQSSGSIFNRRRRSQYKNMEEAAMAVESLLDELKRDQISTKGSGSMSSRLSKGVTKDLRTKQSSSKSDSQMIEVQEEEFTEEPSYFINGVQVEKSEVLKLSKNNIINREIRVRNTVTNNPNGEVWYTVKEDKQD